MKRRQMVGIRLIFLPLSLFGLIVAIDQNSWLLMFLFVLVIILVIVWWYIDEVNKASNQAMFKQEIIEKLKTFDVGNPVVSFFEVELKESLLMEKLWTFDSCKSQLTLSGVYEGVRFVYKEVVCKGVKPFSGHVLHLRLPQLKEHKLEVFDAFPYNLNINKETVVGVVDGIVEVAVLDVFYLREANDDVLLQTLLSEIEAVIQGVQNI